MANTGAKLSSFPEVNDIQTGDMFPLLSGGNTNAKIDYATLADAIIAKLKSEDVVQMQTNNANKLISAALAYSMNQDILQLEEDTSTEQEEKSVTAELVTVNDADGGDAGLTLNLEPVQAGSGDPSSDNVRPISGWTGAKVTRAGKNLIDMSDITDYSKWSADIAPSGNMPSDTNNRIYSLPALKSGVQYTISFGVTSASFPKFLYFGYYKDNSTNRIVYITTDYINNQSISFTAIAGVTYCLRMGAMYNEDAFKAQIAKLSYIQLELGSTATDYEPYQGETYHITLPSEAGTVYGGTLDVTTGVLTVTDAQIASYAGETLPREWISDRDVYVAGTTPTTGAQVVYKLATPLTYSLTPIEVTTLLGDNTIWMDAEGTIKLDYKTNAIATKGDVNDAFARIKALAKITEAIAPVESSYTATQNYAIGDYLIVDYKLYKVTAVITSGATITEGTNVTATTIMAEIKALA